MAAILGIEADHFDCFADLNETIQAFHEFAMLLPADGLLVVPATCKASLTASAGISARVEQPGATLGRQPPLRSHSLVHRLANRTRTTRGLTVK